MAVEPLSQGNPFRPQLPSGTNQLLRTRKSHWHRGFSPVNPSCSRSFSRFNGFETARETVETVHEWADTFSTGRKPRC